MTSIFSAVVPVMLIIVVGFLAGYTLPIQIQTLSLVTLYILYPALIFDSFYQTNISVENSTALSIGFIITSCFVYVVALFFSKITNVSSSTKTAFMATVLFSNNGNMGLPITTFFLGNVGLEIALLYMICSSILMFCIGPILLQGKTIIYGIRRALKSPLVWSIVIGMIWRIYSLDIPLQLYTSIHKLGGAAIPIALLLLGIQLTKTQWQFGTKELIPVMIRLLLAPLIAYFVGTNLHLNNLNLQVLVIQGSMPTAVSSLVLITEFDGDNNFMARTIIMSTLMSFVTIPLILWLLNFTN